MLSAGDIVKRMVKEGHIVGNHSWHHPDLTTVSDQRIREELKKVSVKTKELTGQKEMKYLRPPRGYLVKERCRLLMKRALRMYSGHSLSSIGM